MNKKLQCKECGKAVYGEDLYNYDGEILCRYCIVSRVYEGLIPCEYVGTCNDKTYPNKNQQINQLKQQLEDEKKLHSLAKAFYDEKQAEFDKLLYDYNKLKQQLAETEQKFLEFQEDSIRNEQTYVIELAEKDKEIESLKQQLEETNAGYDFTYEQSRETIKELKQNQTQLAIQELEKVKTWCDGIIRSNFDMTGSNKDKNLEVLSMKLDKQIKELKGEKDVED